jgi:hypothetical protein
MAIDIAAAPDVLVRNAGSTCVFCPVTERAKGWFRENFRPPEEWHVRGPEEWQQHEYWVVGESVVIETRHAFDFALTCAMWAYCAIRRGDVRLCAELRSRKSCSGR